MDITLEEENLKLRAIIEKIFKRGAVRLVRRGLELPQGRGSQALYRQTAF